MLILNAQPQNLSERKQKKKAILITSIDGDVEGSGLRWKGDFNTYALEPPEFYTR